jgi:hypothetical protein
VLKSPTSRSATKASASPTAATIYKKGRFSQNLMGENHLDNFNHPLIKSLERTAEFMVEFPKRRFNG